MSADGSTIVGWLGPFAPGASSSVILWRASEGTESWGAGDARSLSDDGNVAVGDEGISYASTTGRLWSLASEATEPMLLPPIPGPEQMPGRASLVNARGTVVFGVTRDQTTTTDGLAFTEPYVWTEQRGARFLATVLDASCVDIGAIPWDISWRVTAVADDDKVLVVCGTLQGDSLRCWVAQWE